METRKRILLADDDDDFRFAARVALQTAGYLVSEAANSEEALAQLLEAADSQAPFCLVLTDMEMPVMSGLVLIQEIEVRRIPVAVCAITGCFCEWQTCPGRGRKIPLTCLHKPFTAKELLTMVEMATRDHESSTAGARRSADAA